jgi:hypothetical protein
MSTEQCQRLRDAYRYARSRRGTNVIALMGGPDFFSTGIHLNVIEAAKDPARESWRNLNAINDVVHDIVTTDSHYVIAALAGDAAAGGVPLALAADCSTPPSAPPSKASWRGCAPRPSDLPNAMTSPIGLSSSAGSAHTTNASSRWRPTAARN